MNARIPVGIVVAILLTGCSQQYHAERSLWQANERSRHVLNRYQRVEQLTSADFTYIRAGYQRVIDRAPSTEIAARVQFYIGQLHLYQGDIDAAAVVFRKTVTNFDQFGGLAARAQRELARLYEREGRWEEALDEWERLMNNHEGTTIALEAPLHIARFHRSHSDMSTARVAFRRAVQFYERMTELAFRPAFAQRVAAYQTNTHVEQRQWDAALNAIQKVVLIDPNGVMVPQALRLISRIVGDVVDDPERELAIHRQLLNKVDASVYSRLAGLRYAQLLLEKLELVEAREVLEQVIKDAQDHHHELASAKVLLANVHEAAGDWSQARQLYESVLAEQPDTRAGLQVPLMMARHFLQFGDVDQAQDVLAQAMTRYQTLISEYPDSASAARAQDFISRTNVLQQNWEGSIASLQILVEQYPNSPRAATSLFAIAAIYDQILDEPKKASSAYRRFLEQFPDHAWTSIIQRQIRSVNVVESVHSMTTQLPMPPTGPGMALTTVVR